MKRPPEKLRIILSWGLALATFVAFEEVRLNGFVYDDGLYITNNPHVQAGLAKESVTWALVTPESGSWEPMTWLSHMLGVELFDMDASGHHLVNLLFHIVNAVLLFHLLTKMTGALWPSLFVAAVFALHPLRVESVAWVAERKDVLSGTFWMLSVGAYTRYVSRPNFPRYLLVAAMLTLGLLSKPMLVTLPFVMLLIDVWPLDRLRVASKETRGKVSTLDRELAKRSATQLIVEKIPLFVIVTGFALITFFFQRSQGAMADVETGAFPWSIRIGNAALSYVGYLSNSFYPTGLAVFYPHPGHTLSASQALASMAALLLVTLAVVYAARRGKRYLLVGWLWYIGMLVPVTGFVQVGGQAMADRYTYLPSIGVLIMIAWGAADLFAKWPQRKPALAIASVAVVIALMWSTRLQVRYWRDSFTLYGRALEVTQNNWLAHYNLGRAEMLEGGFDRGITHLEETLRLLPQSAEAHNNLGVALTATRRYDEAIEHLREAVTIDPNFARAHNNWGQALGLSGRLDESVGHFEEAVRLEPDFAKAHYNLCFVFSTQGRTDEALEHCDAALRINPSDSRAAQLKASLIQERTP
jgi:hypothetical protein